MAQVLIRGIAPAVVEKLKVRARLNHRSLEAELRAICGEAVRDPVGSELDEVDRVRALFAGRAFSDSATLVREDRDR